MAAGREYEERVKFECLQFIVPQSPVEGSYIDGSAYLSVKISTKQEAPKEHLLC
jgi:hypothetical protein